MALTAKPISTISYNTKAFLDRKLKALFDAHIINDYRYIFHDGENGDKEHFHVYIEPNRRLDTGKLRDDFNEIQTQDEKPLGCMPFRSSKGNHWIMYVIHDPQYLLAHKSQDDGDGKKEYSIDSIETPFKEQLDRDYKVALRLRNTDNQKIYDSITEGRSLSQIAYEDDINPMKILAIQNLIRIDTQRDAINEAMADKMMDLQRQLEQERKNNQTLIQEMNLRELEYKTGQDLHNIKDSVFDEEIKK